MSDKDIKKLLGYHIFIYPFDPNSLKAASYNLKASNMAFIRMEGGKQELIAKPGKIVIPAHETAIIETQESIYVSAWITDSVDYEQTWYMGWIFPGYSEVNDDLPENTTLQRKLKEHLLLGKKFGIAKGHLVMDRVFEIVEKN